MLLSSHLNHEVDRLPIEQHYCHPPSSLWNIHHLRDKVIWSLAVAMATSVPAGADLGFLGLASTQLNKFWTEHLLMGQGNTTSGTH